MTQTNDDDTTPDTPVPGTPSGVSGGVEWDGEFRRHRVTFGAGALVIGFLVAITVIAAVLAALFASSSPDPVGSFFGLLILALLYGLPIGALTGLPLAILLAVVLKRVGNQWVHVGAFFLFFTAVSFPLLGLMFPGGWPEALLMAVAVGIASALGRASVWKLARIG